MLNDISLVAVRRPRGRRLLLDLHRHSAGRRPQGARAGDEGAQEAGPGQARPRRRQGPAPSRTPLTRATTRDDEPEDARPPLSAGSAQPAAPPAPRGSAAAPRASADDRAAPTSRTAAQPDPGRTRTIRSRAWCSRTSPRCWPTRRPSPPSPTPSRSCAVRHGATKIVGLEARGFILAAPVGRPRRDRLHPRPQGGQAARRHSRRRRTTWSTAARRSRCTPRTWRRVTGSWSSTTYSPPAAPPSAVAGADPAGRRRGGRASPC